MPDAAIIGVLPFALGTFGVVVGLARIPIGVDIAGKVAISGAAGTAIFATQRAQRPRWIGCSQDPLVLEVSVVRSGCGCGGVARQRRRVHAQISDEIDAARLRVGGDWSGIFDGDASPGCTVRERAV